MRKQGLTLIREGEIYITSKRIMVVGAGTSVIPHTRVLDVEVDFDHKLITITKDGREKPLYIGASDAIFCGKLIEHLSQQQVGSFLVKFQSILKVAGPKRFKSAIPPSE